MTPGVSRLALPILAALATSACSIGDATPPEGTALVGSAVEILYVDERLADIKGVAGCIRPRGRSR